MQNFLEEFDRLAGIGDGAPLARQLERASFAFIILMFVFAPHSIAATQTAWLTGMFIWVIRLFIKPRPPLVRTPLDIPLWTFFAWSVVSSVLSYDPPVSLDKLRNVALFLIFYYVINVIKTKRAAVFLASAMIASTMVSVAWTPIERIFGRGVEVTGVAADSPLTRALLRDGDTLLKANGKKIKTPDDLVGEIQADDTTKVDVYRPDFYITVEVKRADLLGGASALEKLGISGWKRSRNWRSTGFYSHYATFAEVLQLIASLVFGLFVASLGRRFLKRSRQDAPRDGAESSGEKRGRASLLLAVCLAGMAIALLLTVTRASQLAFLISAFAIVLVAGNRRMILILTAIVLPAALIGLVFLQQSRQVGFFDLNDDSIKDRQTFYRKGFDLWTAGARNFTLGVGMDSNKRFIKEWNLYDNGGKPMGHFHSTPLQLAVERGLPAVLLWFWVLWVYARVLLSYFRVRSKDDGNSDKGIILGSFGGMIGFVAGGMVHYNLGDAEVAMVFFMLMGLSIASAAKNFKAPAAATASAV